MHLNSTQYKITWISGSATTYALRSLSPNARETARTPPTRQVPSEVQKHFREISGTVLLSEIHVRLVSLELGDNHNNQNHISRPNIKFTPSQKIKIKINKK